MKTLMEQARDEGWAFKLGDKVYSSSDRVVGTVVGFYAIDNDHGYCVLSREIELDLKLYHETELIGLQAILNERPE